MRIPFGFLAATAAPPPSISAVSPSHGPESTATTITIDGTDFVNGCTVTLNGFSCTSVTFVSSIQVTCDTPSNMFAGGPYDVTLTNPDTQSDTYPNAYTFDAPSDPITIGGADLFRWYGENYTAATGVFVDEAGNANTTQATSAFRPAATTIAGNVAIDCDNSQSHFLNCGGDVEPFGDVVTVFAIMNVTDGASGLSGTQVLLGKYYSGVGLWGLGSASGDDGKISFWTNGVANRAVSDAVHNDATPVRVIATYDANAAGVTTKLYIDGVLQATTATDAAGIADASDILALGAGASDESTNTAGYVGAANNIGIITRKLSDADIALLDDYLASRL